MASPDPFTSKPSPDPFTSKPSPDPDASKPSVFRVGLIGYLCGSAIGAVASFILAMKPRDYNEVSAYKFLVCVGGFGALSGCLYAIKRRKSLGLSDPNVDEWKQYVGTAPFSLLVVIVILGSFAIAVLLARLFDAVIGRPA
jgi:hypothetical protein